ncbi:MAG: bacteriohemerythrin [Spirochaetales bacterium]|nr:bacteriohemerythrin [Spirochaetales bacterium]
MSKDRSLLWLLLLLVAVLISGTVGYWLIEYDWNLLDAFYMTVITLTTIGFGEVKELSPAGRMFTLLIIVLGIGAAASIVSKVGQMIIESGLNDSYGRKRMMKKISALSGHYIICGYGRIGSAIALKLYEQGTDFVVIESDQTLYESVTAKGFISLLGDSTSDATLLAAGVQRAVGTILCINDDGTNVNIALAARELNRNQKIIARGSDPAVEYRLIRAGADRVVYPLQLGGEQIARLLTKEEEEERKAPAPELLGYELRLYKNLGSAQTAAELLKGKDSLKPIALQHLDGSLIHGVNQDVRVGPGESLLLLIHRDEGGIRRELNRDEVTLLEWSDELSLGIAQIDDEHRMLFKYALDFQNAVLQGETEEKVGHFFELLIRYTETHFSQEEALMKESHYPEWEEHHLIHERLTTKVMELNRDKRFLYSDTIWDFLQNWLTEHILVMDRAFAKFLAHSREA